MRVSTGFRMMSGLHSLKKTGDECRVYQALRKLSATTHVLALADCCIPA